MDINLKSLGLEERFPRLVELRDEISELEKQQQAAMVEVQQLRAQLDPAREADLDVEAAAIRSGKKTPEPVNEKKVQAKLEGAERNQRVLTRALDTARQDMAVLVGKHQAQLFADVQAARAEIGAKVAEAAREALKGYTQHEDLFYTLKSLQPPLAPVETGPPGSEDPKAGRPPTNAYIGIVAPRSDAPPRGHVEQVLAYLASLATSAPSKPGDSDAA